jgi:DNA repair protein RecN (Recombination protein N)
MLRFLRIRRLAVIDEVEIDFSPGFNVLTGETGAGKSILVGAVGLLLGGRASGDLVRTGEESATVEAIFDVAGSEVLVRREVTAQGRSRAFIDGELVTANALKELSGRLIELHGQHEHQVLLDATSHLAMLDAFGDLHAQTTTVDHAFRTLRETMEELEQVRRRTADRDARRELLRFQAGELERANLAAGEDEQLAGTRQLLASAERIERLCLESYAALYESDDAVLARLGGVWRRVVELAALDARFQPYLENRDGIKSQLEDLALYLRQYADGVDASPARLEQVEYRLALLERMKRKYGPTLDDVIGTRDRVMAGLDQLDRLEVEMAARTEAAAAARAAYVSAAQTLSSARQSRAIDFSRRLEEVLAGLAMEQTTVQLRFNDRPLPESSWSPRGVDEVEFFVSPNVGEDLRPLARIVSGGELSRVMLAVKTITAAARRAGQTSAISGGGPGLIFDEVDAGIGGRAADVVGRTLRSLGSASQVLCITHLPQVAAYGDVHFAIEKQVEAGRTHTRVTKLSESERTDELARMLGGAAVTDRLRASAREMIRDRRRSAASSSDGGAKGENDTKGESESPMPPRTRSGRKGH